MGEGCQSNRRYRQTIHKTDRNLHFTHEFCWAYPLVKIWRDLFRFLSQPPFSDRSPLQYHFYILDKTWIYFRLLTWPGFSLATNISGWTGFTSSSLNLNENYEQNWAVFWRRNQVQDRIIRNVFADLVPELGSETGFSWYAYFKSLVSDRKPFYLPRINLIRQHIHEMIHKVSFEKITTFLVDEWISVVFRPIFAHFALDLQFIFEGVIFVWIVVSLKNST